VYLYKIIFGFVMILLPSQRWEIFIFQPQESRTD
jgi:hypothetical protein